MKRMNLASGGLLLDNQSITKLFNLAKPYMRTWDNNDISMYCNYMEIFNCDTITDSILIWTESNYGMSYNVNVCGIGFDEDKIIAVKIDTDIPIPNNKKYIILAVNEANGSIDDIVNIKAWRSIDAIPLKGTIQYRYKD